MARWRRIVSCSTPFRCFASGYWCDNTVDPYPISWDGSELCNGSLLIPERIDALERLIGARADGCD